MPARNVELDPVEMIAAAAVGEPGRRQFFLLARGSVESVTLACEKFHIQGLVAKARELLESQELAAAEVAAVRPANNPQVAEADWRIGELGLGFHESRRRFVIVAREAAETDEEEAGEAEVDAADEEASSDLAVARLWVTPEQVRDFTEQADSVIAAGRPLCRYCGLPIDPGGHPCPASNGSRPIF